MLSLFITCLCGNILGLLMQFYQISMSFVNVSYLQVKAFFLCMAFVIFTICYIFCPPLEKEQMN